MKPECPKFYPQGTQERFFRFGWVSIPIDTPKAVVEEFAERHRCSVTAHFFNYMLKPLEAAAETTAEREAHWEKIRREQYDRKQRLAAARKKRETQTK